MSTKRLSLKGLADFVTAAPAKQRTILHQYKYPHEDEAQARILYYREARDRIAAYHRANHEPRWMVDEADRHDDIAVASNGQTKTRLRHNARALRAYAEHFAIRRFDIMKDVSLWLRYGDVSVSVHPDLHVRENQQEKIIKLEFSKDEPRKEMVQIISQAMLEAASAGGMGLSSGGVLFLDVTRGTEHKAARFGSRMQKNIEAACKTISDVWDSI